MKVIEFSQEEIYTICSAMAFYRNYLEERMENDLFVNQEQFEVFKQAYEKLMKS